VHRLNRPEKHVFWEASAMHGEDFVRSGDPYTTVVRNVCESCNNGWMSALQDQAKPIVYALANGEWPVLDVEQRRVLARWSTMVTVNLECYARMLRTTQFQRTTLMNGDMPSGWRLGIGKMADTDCAGRSFDRAIAVPIGIGKRDEYLTIGSTYFVIELAAFHTLSSLGDIALSGGLLGAGLSEVKFPTTDIWPKYFAENSQEVSEITGFDLDNIQRHFGYDG
jgi:hypothetical protein